MTKVKRALLRDRIERTVAGELTGKHVAREGYVVMGIRVGGEGSPAMWRRARKAHAQGRSFR
ncbi:hypothetical protein TEK04_19440 [Klenkia sp. LSe6-5]|uniref:Uncharacterized protein n=1 Tax=Klenkia sesuvii TaxID=3103137 RepID=A0ABU8DYX1_9ACTN